MIRRTLKLGSATLSVIALAAAFTAVPALIGHGPMDAAAYAKEGNGKGGGKGGGKGATKSASAQTKTTSSGGKGATKRLGGDLDRAIGRLLGTEKQRARTTGTSKGGGKKPTAVVEPEVEVTSVEESLTPLAPNQKGKWNAANANQRALDAHIRNENFNGTIGALSYYQLAGKAAAGEELNEYEQRALDNLLGDITPEITDSELEALLNSGDEGAPVWSVVDGAATCVENCDEADTDAANQDIADYVDEQGTQAEEQAIQDLWASAQQRIIDDSNKPTEGIEDQLLDELASQLGFERVVPEKDPVSEDEDVVVLPDDEEIIVITE